MTVAEIIALLENPTTIVEALDRASKEIPFRGSDRVLFEMKREMYTAGMSDYEKLNWIQEMTALLQPYAVRYGGYQSDLLNRWHHFNKQELKRRFDKLRRSSGKLKVLFIEYDADPLSLQVHEILFSHSNSTEQNATPSGYIKGGAEYELDLSEQTLLDGQWSDFMISVFGLPKSSSVADGFMEKNLGAQSHFVVQKIHAFNAENFDRYYAFWKSLTLEEPIFLFFYLESDVFHAAPSAEEFLHCPCSMHSLVQNGDFTLFFARYRRCYKEDLALCHGEPMPFRDALEQLQYCELDY